MSVFWNQSVPGAPNFFCVFGIVGMGSPNTTFWERILLGLTNPMSPIRAFFRKWWVALVVVFILKEAILFVLLVLAILYRQLLAMCFILCCKRDLQQYFVLAYFRDWSPKAYNAVAVLQKSRFPWTKWCNVRKCPLWVQNLCLLSSCSNNAQWLQQVPLWQRGNVGLDGRPVDSVWSSKGRKNCACCVYCYRVQCAKYNIIFSEDKVV